MRGGWKPAPLFLFNMIVNKLASAIYNDVQGGLQGYEATINMSIEQLEDEVVEERLAVIKKYSLQNIIPQKDLLYSINCIELDCKSLDKCCDIDYSDKILHFEIPQIVNDFGEESIAYIGSIDKQVKFKVYTSVNFKFHKYKTRGKKRPYVYIDTTPNEHNMYDGYVFNAPMLERISVIAVFKDPRQVQEFMEEQGCCEMTLTDADNMTWIASEVKQNLITKKLKYYRQLLPQPLPNTQNPA